MSDQVQQALEQLKQLAGVDELRADAAAGLAPAERPKTNSHIHLPPNFSAFESVSQAVELASAENIAAVGVTNYYDYSVYGDFVRLARDKGIFPLFGLEVICLVDDLVQSGVRVNDPGNPGKFYLCGKAVTNFEPMTPGGAEIIEHIRRCDAARMAEMIGKMEVRFADAGVESNLSEQAVIDMICRRHDAPRETVWIQERHIAMAFQDVVFAKVPADKRIAWLEKLFAGPTRVTDPEDAVAVQGELRSQLMKAGKPAFVPEAFVDFPTARQLVLEFGGIPCYPTLADGADPICEFETPIDKLIDNIRELGIHCAEFIPIRNEPDVLGAYVRAMRQAGLVVTAGTEHNTLSLLPIEPQCLRGQEVPEDVKDIFWEGTCVAAAHQHLTLCGAPGFVDAEGNPNGDYPDAASRIDAFARLGAALIERHARATR